MPRVIHRNFRFLLIDRCLRDTGKKYRINDLVEICNIAMQENYGVGISKRTVQYDLSILKKAPFSIDLDEDLKKQGVYRYTDVKCLPLFTLFDEDGCECQSRSVNSVVCIPQPVMRKAEEFFRNNGIDVLSPIWLRNRVLNKNN